MRVLRGRPIGVLLLSVWLLTGPASSFADDSGWGEVASGPAVDNLFTATFMGAGLALMVTGIVLGDDDSDRYSFYIYNDDGVLEEISLYPEENSSWREDPEALVIAGAGCLALALFFHLLPAGDESTEMPTNLGKLQDEGGIGLETRWLGDGPAVGLGGSF